MNAGFSNLITLKKYLLAIGVQASTDFDASITTLGLGVATSIGKFCNRQFAYNAAAQDVISADRLDFSLCCLPVQAIATIELKFTERDGWQALVINDVINTIDNSAGIVHFAGCADVGPDYAQVRFTYSGGFWWDTTEDNTGVMPGGATALPDNLKLAWLLQCELIWKKHDKLGTDISEGKGGRDYELQNLDLSPAIKSMLEGFRRYSMI